MVSDLLEQQCIWIAYFQDDLGLMISDRHRVTIVHDAILVEPVTCPMDFKLEGPSQSQSNSLADEVFAYVLDENSEK